MEEKLMSNFTKIKNFCERYFLQKTGKISHRDFPDGAVVKNLPANSGDMGLIPGAGRSHMPRRN